jgi:hypothetical protein
MRIRRSTRDFTMLKSRHAHGNSIRNLHVASGWALVHPLRNCRYIVPWLATLRSIGQTAQTDGVPWNVSIYVRYVEENRKLTTTHVVKIGHGGTSA